MSGELLIEFFSEEIPARMQAGAMESFKILFTEKMTGQGISFSGAEAYATPRRLVLHIQGLPEKQEDRAEERRGPRIDAPQSALDGFLASTGVKLSDCEKRETPKGTFYFVTVKKKGEAVRDILPKVVREIIYEFPWPKSMRWAGGQYSWVRPLHSGVCVFEREAVSFDVWMGEEGKPDVPCVPFRNISYGHRFLNPASFEVKNFSQYAQELRDRFVILDREERKKEIIGQGQKLAAEMGYKLRDDPGLLEEVAGLVEWPVFYAGSIDPSFMTLPPEILVTVMRVHQRYFALETLEGKLAPCFIIVANTLTQDQGKNIITGNERVLKARLSDAQFFYHKDREQPLELHRLKLQNIIFHHELGTMWQKTERLKALATSFAPEFGLNPDFAAGIAEILKADLVTEIVGEFPELQGTMGKYYAISDKIDPEIAQTIEEHYSPKGSHDHLPASKLGRFLALIDRLDTLAGFFSIGIKPTGSKDPYALRRTALGIIRLLEDEKAILNFDALLRQIYESLTCVKKISLEQLNHELREFFADRLKVYWRDQGFFHDVMAAAFAVGQTDPFYVLKRRCQALQEFLKSKNEAGPVLLSAYRRACNIIRIEEARDNAAYTGEIDTSLLQEEAEKQLVHNLQNKAHFLEKAFELHDFTTVMRWLAMLKPSIDAYFNSVTVNVGDSGLRANRLKTLSLFRSTLEKVADFSKIQ